MATSIFRGFIAQLVRPLHRYREVMGSNPVEALNFSGLQPIDLFSLYVLFSHFRPHDATLGNSFFQRSSYARAHVRINYEETKGKFP